MKKYQWLLVIIFLIFASYWAIKPLFQSGFFPMHDDEQIARLFELDQALMSKQFPPRWVGNLGFGYGYPFYNFYPPLIYYLGEIFHLLDFSLIVSTKIVMGLGFLFSGIFIYLLARELYNKFGALVAAVFYIYAPYHAVDLYVRGALAEFYAFVFLPAVFWSTLRLIKTRSRKWLVINSLFLSGLLLSHNLIFIIFAPFYLLFSLFFTYFQKERKKIIILLAFSGFLFLGITAYFWLPALVERKYTLVNTILTRELASYKHHFVYLRQLWSSPWGYGGSIYGLEDGISFQVGKLHLILSFLAGALGFPLSFFFLLFICSLFMTSFHSQFIWDRFKSLWYLQFPWRFLTIAALFSSLLSGGAVGNLVNKIADKKYKWLIVSISVLLVILFNQRYFRPARYLNVDDSYYTNEEDLKWRVSKMSFEFVPQTVGTKLSDIGTTQVDISESEIARNSYEILDGDLEVKEIGNVLQRKIFETKKEGKLRINTYYFPGWKAFIDQKEVEIKETGKLKLITLEIPDGEHRVEVIFTNTPVRTLANMISLISLLSLVVVFIGSETRKKISVAFLG